MSRTYRRTSGVNEEDLRELGGRLAAAYVSYSIGHKGVDRILKKVVPEEVGVLWIDLADLLFSALKSDSAAEDLRLRDVITKLIQ